MSRHSHLPHKVATAEVAVSAHHVVAEDGSSTIFRRAVAEGLSALGFGGIISAFGAVVTAVTHSLAPQLFAGMTGLPSTTGLLLTAAVAGAGGAISMLGSSAIRAQLDHENTERRVVEQAEHPATVVPLEGVTVTPKLQQDIAPEVADEKSVSFVEMVEQQRRQAQMQQGLQK